MKLVFHGGGYDRDNRELNLKAIELSGEKKPVIAYIPAQSYDSEVDFRDFVKEHQKYGLRQFLYFPIDYPFDNTLKRELLKADIIHLSGGNTFHFLKYLKEHKVFNDLKNFAKKGGILTGLSAGAIVMTPRISAATYPDFDCDENEVGLLNFTGMGLVKFEFFPHYSNSRRYDDELKKQSLKLKYPLYAAPDGAGVIVEEDKIKFVGKVACFFQGKKMFMN
ncbi:MAG: hypothetical protein COW00_04920 [Bdellovibrio sp. CG12_big_fil_rev_8_21_14_0_65_39_13]|nr:MAG: hypothetical protein COW78_13120 [Bdellovibrio sp. CG22_combo_CG10-13_8_21_14_all_39_27]PIQ61151.1 MAG: hypothetical protein COW00_04920 [Bdellovibrio sp. CG12_big_fil_rev_8_21_14_0_65_39_13]PIR34823.1 MAG: hypothetical protein COV37_11190 [Bdellovibrio sp. CG11_big_fil_rev_8_21_14_0_20_39_38]PJB53672.1 MAG: hypothetical protein CO099_05860 [Bdellovibrio sp. CG_4_9_14_3_um_filter_39_7]